MSTFIVFAEDWQRHPSSSQHLMQQLGQQHNVIWVNSIGLRSPRLSLNDITRLWHKGLALLDGKAVNKAISADHKLTEPCAVVSPCCIPFHQFSAIRWLNRQLLRWQLKRQLAALNIPEDESLILWLALPSAVCIVGALKEQQVVYYCGDDFSSLAGVDHTTMTELELHLAAKADVILCASEKLRLKFSSYRSYLVTHGVDLSLFSGQYPRPDELSSERPIAGFYGLVADWVDVNLISVIARRCPEWDFVLIGRHQTDISPLLQCNNVKFIAEMPHYQLAVFASHFQALLLPFRQCQQIEFCNPLKLREYLALGQPVLSVPFPALVPYRQLVLEMTQISDWVKALQDIDTWSAARRLLLQQASRAAVSADSWTARAAQIEFWLGCRQNTKNAECNMMANPKLEEL